MEERKEEKGGGERDEEGDGGQGREGKGKGEEENMRGSENRKIGNLEKYAKPLVS